MVRRKCDRRAAANRGAVGQGALRGVWAQHVSGCDIYLAAFVWTGEGLPDEWNGCSLQDHFLRLVRPGSEFQLQGSVRIAATLSGWQGQSGSGHTIQLRND